MYGPSGEKAYTASLLNILSSAQLVKTIPPKYYDEYNHRSCNQARYMMKQKNRTQNKNNQNNKDISNSTNSGNTNSGNYQYTVPTNNRYAQLGDFFPGNF